MKHAASRLAILPLVLALITIIVASAAMTMPASAATSGPLDAGTGTNVDGPGTVNWSDPGNITTAGAPYATAVIAGAATSEYLQGSNYGFSIPLDATIDGITVSIMRMDSGENGIVDAGLYLLKSGAIVGTNHASAVKWPTAMAEATYGDAADLWGTTWTAAEINATGFGVSLSAVNTHPAQNRTATVDYMRITVTYTPATTPTTLTVSAAAGTYGGTANLTATLSPAAAGRTISFTLNGVSAGTADTDGSGVANIPAADLTGIDAGTYPAGVGASFAGDASYGSSSGSNSLTVNAMSITVTADDKSKTYGGADPALTYQITSGSLVGGDSFTGVLSRVVGENVGTYAIQQGTLAIDDGNGGNNYSLTFLEGTFTISVRNITVTADDKSMTYGNADPALTYQITSGSLVGGDSFTGVLSRAAGENVGTYAIQQGTLAIDDGNGGNNYNLTFMQCTLTIGARDITVTADDKSMTYGNADPALTYQITSGSLVGGDSFSGAVFRVVGENVGTYDIEQGTLAVDDGNGGNNYNLTFVDGIFTISVRSITVTADDKSKTYGGADPVLTYQVTSGSLVGGDSFSGAVSRVVGENVGTYDIEQGTLTVDDGNGGNNYNLTYVEGTLTVGPRNITVTADDTGKTYGGADPALTYQVTSGSLVGGDSFTGALSRVAGENVGTYAIQQGTLAIDDGNGGNNYNLTFIEGTLTVGPRNITGTADDKGKTYGGADPALTYQITSGSLVGGDSFTGVLSRAAGENVGSYAIQQGTLVINDGNGGNNYAFTFVSGEMAITPRELTVTGIVSVNKTYDGSTNAAVDFSSAVLLGVISGDDVVVDISGAVAMFADRNVGSGKTVTVTGLILAGADMGNYLISPPATTADITPKPLTITANSRSKTYGDTVAFAGTEFSSAGLVNGDTVSSVTLTSSGATAGAAAGTYTITPSAAVGAGLGNYSISYVNGTLTVGHRALTISASSRSKTYGDACTFAGTEFTASSLVGGDSVASVTLASAGATAAATVAGGPYLIVPSAAAGTGLGNYSISYINGTLTVSPKALTITANDRAKTSGDTVTFAGTEFTVSGLVAGDTVTSVILTSTGATASAGVGAYDISADAAAGTGLDNYAITYVSGTLTVNEMIPPVKPPVVDSISPKSGHTGDTIDVIIEGTDFTGATAVDFGPGVTVNSFVIDSPNRITANITIDPGASPGLHDVTVITQSDDSTLPEAFSITEDSPAVPGSWWLWLPLALLPIIAGLLLFFLFYRRRKKKTLQEVMARHSYSGLEGSITVTAVHRSSQS